MIVMMVVVAAAAAAASLVRMFCGWRWNQRNINIWLRNVYFAQKTHPSHSSVQFFNWGKTSTFGIGYRFFVAFNQSAIFWWDTDTIYNQFSHAYTRIQRGRVRERETHSDSVITIVIFCSLSFHTNLHIRPKHTGTMLLFNANEKSKIQFHGEMKSLWWRVHA